MSVMASHRRLDCLPNRFQTQIKENIKTPRHWPLWGDFTGDRWIPRTKAQSRANVSIWWRHHEYRPILFTSLRNTSMAIQQYYDCLGARDATLKCRWVDHMNPLGTHSMITTAKQNNTGSIFNSLAPVIFGCYYKNVTFNLVLLIGTFRFSYDYTHRWVPWGVNDDKSTLVQVMVWCRQTTSN